MILLFNKNKVIITIQLFKKILGNSVLATFAVFGLMVVVESEDALLSAELFTNL